MAQIVSLAASPRTTTGKGAARQARFQGKVPAVIYGHGRETQSLEVEAKALEKALTGVEPASTIIELAVDGTKTRTLIREIQRHPIRPDIIHVDFYEIHAEEKVKLRVPVHLAGNPDGVRNAGGVLDQVTREVEIEVMPDNIPDRVELDVTALKIGDSLHVRDLNIPNATILTLADLTIATVVPPRAQAHHGHAPQRGGAGLAPRRPRLQSAHRFADPRGRLSDSLRHVSAPLRGLLGRSQRTEEHRSRPAIASLRPAPDWRGTAPRGCRRLVGIRARAVYSRASRPGRDDHAPDGGRGHEVGAGRRRLGAAPRHRWSAQRRQVDPVQRPDLVEGRGGGELSLLHRRAERRRRGSARPSPRPIVRARSAQEEGPRSGRVRRHRRTGAGRLAGGRTGKPVPVAHPRGRRDRPRDPLLRRARRRARDGTGRPGSRSRRDHERARARRLGRGRAATREGPQDGAGGGQSGPARARRARAGAERAQRGPRGPRGG